MTPTRSYGSSPPSPVPFVPPTASDTCRNATWDEYLAGTSANGSYEFGGGGFQAAMSFDVNVAANRGPQDRRVPTTTYPSASGYASPSTSGGPSPSFSARRSPSFPAPPPRRLSPAPMKPNQKRNASPSPLPSPVAYPMLSSMPPSPSMVPFPTSDGMKTVAMKTVPTPTDLAGGTQVGRWTKREHELFLEGLQRFGRSWKKISSLVRTRTLVQIRTHAQKYLQKQSRATIKADAKAAETGASRDPPSRLKAPQHQSKTRAAGQLTVQMNGSSLPSHPWKSPRSGDRSSFAPVAFPSSLSTSVSTASSRSALQLNSINRLDQLLQDDTSAIPAFVDAYYTSPTAIEDDLLRPLYTGEQWVPRLGPSPNYSNKRRRVETSSPACSSAPTSASSAVPVLRPAFGAVFEPLPAPDNLSSPSTSPTTHPQRQPPAAAVLLAAHETDESTSCTNAWL